MAAGSRVPGASRRRSDRRPEAAGRLRRVTATPALRRDASAHRRSQVAASALRSNRRAVARALPRPLRAVARAPRRRPQAVASARRSVRPGAARAPRSDRPPAARRRDARARAVARALRRSRRRAVASERRRARVAPGSRRAAGDRRSSRRDAAAAVGNPPALARSNAPLVERPRSHCGRSRFQRSATPVAAPTRVRHDPNADACSSGSPDVESSARISKRSRSSLSRARRGQRRSTRIRRPSHARRRSSRTGSPSGRNGLE